MLQDAITLQSKTKIQYKAKQKFSHMSLAKTLSEKLVKENGREDLGQIKNNNAKYTKSSQNLLKLGGNWRHKVLGKA